MQSNQLFKEELTPIVGTICDRLRTEGNDIYEFGDSSATYTLKAASDKIAIAAIVALYGGYTLFVNIHYPKSAIPLPNRIVEGESDAYFGSDSQGGMFLIAKTDDFFAALNSVLPGTRLHRETLFESMHVINYTAEKWDDFKNLWCKKQREKMGINVGDCLREKGVRLIELCKKSIDTVNADFKKDPVWDEILEKIAKVEYK